MLHLQALTINEEPFFELSPVKHGYEQYLSFVKNKYI
jgi:hypothetical protein